MRLKKRFKKRLAVIWILISLINNLVAPLLVTAQENQASQSGQQETVTPAPTPSPEVAPTTVLLGPTLMPTATPTAEPSLTLAPTSTPTPTPSPTDVPLISPTATPSSVPLILTPEANTIAVTAVPTISPVISPSSLWQKIKGIFDREVIKPKITKANFRSNEPVEVNLNDYLDKEPKILLSRRGELIDNLETKIENGKIIINPPRSFKPGKYTVKISTNSSEDGLIEQTFTWGVLAINTNKSIFLPDEKAYLQMAVLDDDGHTLCKSSLKLEIRPPDGEAEILSTQDGTVKYSDTCGADNVTDNPDYFAYFQTKETGIYNLKLTNLDNNYEIADSFEVKEGVPFEVERIGATRINPSKANYTMNFKIKANEDFKGTVEETVPDSFEINLKSQNSNLKTTTQNLKTVTWRVEFKKGENYELSYEYDAPDVSPQFYLLGPLNFYLRESAENPRESTFAEQRHWQIASDAVAHQSTGSIVVNSATVTLTLVAPTLAANDIMVAILLGKDNIGHTGPAGWVKIGTQTNNTTAMTTSLWWKRAITADSGASFNFTKATDNNIFFAGVIAAYRGARVATSPIDATTPTVSSNASSDTVTYATFDPTATNAQVVAIGIYANDLTTAGAIGGTNPTFANNFDLETSTGTDCSFFGYSGASSGAATGARSHSTTSGTDAINQGWLFGLVAEEPPTVALNTPTDAQTITDTTPDLVFTGTDLNSDTIEYNVQVDTVNTFDSATVTIDSHDQAFDYEAPIASSTDEYSRLGQSFTGDGNKIVSVEFYLGKVGSPTGNVVVELYAHTGVYGTTGTATGSPLATSNVILAQNLTTTTTKTTFAFSGANQYTTVNGTYYVVAVYYAGGDEFSKVLLGEDTLILGHPGKEQGYSYNTSLWSPLTGDVIFAVKSTSTPLLSKFSDIEDPGFVGTGGTHPFDSTEQVTYTVQTELGLGTYYWRVAGKDPLGSNTYGSWATYRSFTVNQTISVSGNIYSDEAITAYNCTSTSLTVKAVVNGVGVGSTGICNTSGGGYLIQNLAVGNTADVVTIFLDGETEKATTVTKIASTSVGFTVPLYQNRILLTHQNGGPITNTNIDKYDSVNDSDIQFTASGVGLTVNSGNKIVIASGKNYTPGGEIQTPAIGVGGTFTPEGNTVILISSGTGTTCTDAAGTVMPLCLNGGTFTPGTSTVNYIAPAATTVAGVTYYNVGVGTSADTEAAATYTLGGNVGVGGTFTVGNTGSTNADILDGSSYTLTLNSSGTPFNVTAKGAYSGSTSTVNYLAPAATTIAGVTYNNVGVGTSAEAGGAATYTLGGNVGVGGTFTVGNTGSTNWDILAGSSYTLTLSGSGTPFNIAKANFDGNTSTVKYTSPAATNITAATYKNLELSPSSVGGPTYTLGLGAGQTLSASGSVTIGDGTNAVTVSTSTYNPIVNVTGNLSVGSSAELSGSGTGKITVNGNVTGVGTINLTAGDFEQRASANVGIGTTSGNNNWTFNNLVFSDSSGSPVTAALNSGGSGSIGIGGTLQMGKTSDGQTTTLEVNTNDRVINANSSVEITSKGVLSSSSTSSFTIAQDFINNGTFTANSGTVTFDDALKTSNIYLGGNGSTQPFFNLFVTTGGKQMKFDETEMLNIGGSFFIQGTDCTDGRVLLDSTTNDNLWDINVTGSADVDYADVEDSNAITALTANNSTGTNNSGWSINAGACSGGNQAPNSPTSLAQMKIDNSIIGAGTWINSTSISIGATASDPDASDTLYLCVENKVLGIGFTDVEDSCGAGVAYSGTAVGVGVTISNLTDGQYHWQVKVKDAAGVGSSWVAFGAGVTRDFGVDTSAPAGGTVYDGLDPGVDKTFNDGSLSSLSANWSGVDSNVSGLKYYEYSIGTGIGATDVKNWTNIGMGTSATANALTLQTSTMYYFNVQATDNAGNVQSPISSDGQKISPSLTFSVSPSSLAFDNLNIGNSFSSTKQATLTTSTNAYGGYIVKTFATDFLRSGGVGYTIPNFTGGTYVSPAVWGGGDIGFGYTSSDTTIQGSNKFGGATLFAPISQTGPGDIVADYTNNISGSPISNDQYTITYKVKTGSAQQAANYSSTVVYTITAIY